MREMWEQQERQTPARKFLDDTKGDKDNNDSDQRDDLESEEKCRI